MCKWVRSVALAAVALMPWGLACGQTTTRGDRNSAVFAPLAQGEKIENLDALKGELKKYHDCTCSCGCYAKDLNTQANQAIAYLQKRAAHPGVHDRLALILDIDETTLSNWDEMSRAGFAYDKKAFDDWVDSAAAPAIPGTLRLYREAKRLGVSVFFLTGRPESQRAASERNLKSQGFTGWSGLILRSKDETALTAQAYKSAKRADLESSGYKLVLNVGDQWSDLKGKAPAEYSVKYPDPYYWIP